VCHERVWSFYTCADAFKFRKYNLTYPGYILVPSKNFTVLSEGNKGGGGEEGFLTEVMRSLTSRTDIVIFVIIFS
jgi:hypothetical protein